MTNKTTYFTVNEALEDILNTLENGYDGYLYDVHHEVFNMDYYIIGTYQAEQALTQYGVFEAFREIQNYENDHFGKVLTDLSNPEHVASMLFSLKGYEAEELIQENNGLWNEKWNDEVDEKTRLSLMNTIRELLDIAVDRYEIVSLYALQSDEGDEVLISANEKDIDIKFSKYNMVIGNTCNTYQKVQGYGIMNKETGFLADESKDIYYTLEDAKKDMVTLD